jgi:putative ABC transport system permease protein
MRGPDLTGTRLAVQGLWFRRSTALIVLVLATVASAASVVAPLYARAAEESILRDTLRRADAFDLSVQVAAPQVGAGVGEGAAPPASAAEGVVRDALTHPAFGPRRQAYVGQGEYHPTEGENAGGLVLGQVVERPGVCAHLPTVTGRCPEAPDEGIMSRRSLEVLSAEVGDVVEAELPDSATLQDGGIAPVVAVQVVGAYDPVPVDDAYWVGRPYFDAFNPDSAISELEEVPPTVDPVFLGTGGAGAARIATYTIDVPLLAPQVRLDDTAPLRRQVRALSLETPRLLLNTDSQLPAALDRADEGRRLVRIAAPLAVIQLVLLSWWTLYLVVGSATEERSPELGLAKLRGLTGQQTRRCGLAEVFLLLLVAAPLGTALGWAAVRSAAGRVFAPGTEVVLTSSVLLTVLGTLGGGIVTAALSSRQVFRRPVSELLRRVPARSSGRAAGLIDAVVVVLAVAGVVQLVNDRGTRPSPVAMLAPGMIAVAGGLLAARVLVRVARRRVAVSTARGRTPGLVGWAGVARRPGTARIASVLAVATCLLLVGVQAWSVAERNRSERAGAETGAAVVLQARAKDPQALVDAVRRADPGGRYAMAAVQVESSSQEPSMLAVDSTRADRVLAWGAPDAGPSRGIASTVAPATVPSLRLHPGPVEVDVDLDQMESPTPLTVSAKLDVQGGFEHLALGRLREGEHTYRGEVPGGCEGGCRLAGLAFSHPGTDIASATARLHVAGLSGTDESGDLVELEGSFGVPGGWRPGAPTIGGPEVRLRAGRALLVDLRTPGGPYAEVARGDSPEPLPAVVTREAAGPSAAQGGVPVGETTGMSGRATRFTVSRVVDYAPRAGARAVVVDLELALRLDDQAQVGQQQVWLSRSDKGDEQALVRSLRRSGVAVQSRETAAGLERVYAGDGAVLALRLLLVCGAAAVVVSVGALLVAAYVGRRQRAYEVAALRAVGLRRRTVRALLLRENVGTVLVALACGALASLLAVWAVLPALPQFDSPSSSIPVRYAPVASAGWLAVGALAGLLVLVGLTVATLQLRAGRSDRLREGVR